jgi:hypothetical protein
MLIRNLGICHTNKIEHFHSSNIANEKKKEYSNVCLTILATTKNEVARTMNIHLTQIYFEQYAKEFLLNTNIFNKTFLIYVGNHACSTKTNILIDIPVT